MGIKTDHSLIISMLLPWMILLWAVCLSDPVYLTKEELDALPRSRDPVPFDGRAAWLESSKGHPLLADLREECRYHSNDKHTYFVCPFRWVFRVDNRDRQQKMVMGSVVFRSVHA